MALVVTFQINNDELLGKIGIQRMEGTAEPGSLGLYKVVLMHDGGAPYELPVLLGHRYGDGAYALTMKAIQALLLRLPEHTLDAPR